MITLNNQVQLIGRVGQDLELKETKNGKKFLNFSLATNEFYKNAKGERVKETTWHKIVAWNKPAELLTELVEKGNQILVKGKLINKKYEDKKGVMHYITEISIGSFVKLDKKEKADLPF